MKNKINVLQVTFGMGIGGMERVIQTICRGIDKYKYSIRVFCSHQKGDLAAELEKDGFEIIYPQNQTRLDRYLRARDIARVIRHYEIDIVHTHHTPSFIDSYFAAKITKVPVFINTDHCKKYPIPWRYGIAERTAAAFADRVVAVSNHTKNDLVQHVRIPSNKIDVIYNGIDFPKTNGLKNMETIRTEFGIAKDEMIVGCVSRLDEQKGYPLFIDSAALILNENPKVKFMIVGGGIKEKELKSQANRLGIGDKIIFTGWRLDASRILKIFDVFLLTSIFEGMPIVLIEAMAAGKAIVATSVGGNPEVVKHGVNGYIVNERSPEIVSKYVNNILLNEKLRDNMQKKSLDYYRNTYRSDQMVEAYQNLYESMLRKKGMI